MNTDGISKFEKYLEKDLNPALEELKGIDSDNNRIYIQKLLYADLVNRFDYMMEETLRDNIPAGSLLSANLRQRHPEKMKTLLEHFGEENIDKIRNNYYVEHKTGQIVEGEFKQAEGRVRPSDIFEYAEWLYCRRNGIVHGDKIRYTEKSKNTVKRESNYAFSLTDENGEIARFRIFLSSFAPASTFYRCVCDLIKG